MAARQTDLITYPTLTAFKADTIIGQQISDEVQIEDILSPGVTHVARLSGAETPDDLYIVRKTNHTSVPPNVSDVTFWASSVNKLVAGNVNVAFSALPDNAEETVTVTVTGVVPGKAYDIGVVSGLPTDVELILTAEVAVDTLKFIFKNNSGVTLTAGTAIVNVYELK